MNLKCVQLDKETDCARVRIAIEPAGFIDTDLYFNRQTLQRQISWPSNYLPYLFQKGCENYIFCKIIINYLTTAFLTILELFYKGGV